MNILRIVSVILISISGIFACYRQLQMFQQNSYFLSRYFKWVKNNFSFRSAVSCILIVLTTISLVFKIDLLLFITSLLSLIRIKTAFNDNNKSIKKLVLTARIKRIYFTIIVFIAMFIAVGFINNLLFILPTVLSFVPCIYICIASVIMMPVEKIIKNYYINDAKRILKESPNINVIGITGSYGKTSTKYILGRILSEKYNTVITPKSYNTPLGVVKTIREEIKPQTQVFIAEMGAKQVGNIKEICNIVNANYGIITSIGPQHLDTFKTMENIVSTKFELADDCFKRNGTVFLNKDNEYIKSKKVSGNVITYGTTKDCDFYATNIKYSRRGLSFDVIHNNETIELNSRLLGIHNAINITGAIALAKQLNVSNNDIAFAVSKLAPVEHRLEIKNYINSSILIDDAYNANPSGCLEAVKVLGSFEGMKKIIVTPGLIELGEKEYECNKNLGIEAAKYCDIIILVGKKRSVPIYDGIKEQGFNEKNLFIAESFKDAVSIFSPLCNKDTVILFENDLPDNYAG